jgi:hypothetical protein
LPSTSWSSSAATSSQISCGDRRFTRLTSKEAAQKAYDQVVRAAWRELFLLIKAKLVAVESKRITIRDEFLAYTVIPDGRTVSEWLQPQLEDAYTSGKMPPLLPGAET